jgi:Rab-GTPase-TBC domain
MAVSGAERARQQNPNLYRERLKGKINEDTLSCISTDLPRTFPDNINYKATANAYSRTGQLQLKAETQPQQLFNVLTAFAKDNLEIGYCQVALFFSLSLFGFSMLLS